MIGSRTKRAMAVVVGLGVAGTAMLGYGAYQRDIQSARERVSTGSRIADTPCGPVEYATAGRGPAVLVIHGSGGGYDQGLDIGSALVDRGLQVIAMSRFGYLRTPLPLDASAPAQADAHVCLLEALDVPRAVVLGGSAGAPSAVQLALRHPDRVAALVLLVPALYVARPDDTPSVRPAPGTRLLFDTALRSDFLFWAALKLARRAMIRGLLATPPEAVDAASPAEQARVARMLSRILPVSPRRLGLLNDAEIISGIERYALERILTPTLAVSVEDDLFGTFEAARYTAEQIPGARFIGYPSGGHVWVGHQERLMADIGAFLESSAVRP